MTDAYFKESHSNTSFADIGKQIYRYLYNDYRIFLREFAKSNGRPQRIGQNIVNRKNLHSLQVIHVTSSRRVITNLGV